jgi:hypothetical protein
MRSSMLVLSVLSVPFTLTHVVEDFPAGIPAARFGQTLLPAAFLLSIGHTAQLSAAALSAHGDVRGDFLNLLLAVVWWARRPITWGEIPVPPDGSRPRRRRLESARARRHRDRCWLATRVREATARRIQEVITP